MLVITRKINESIIVDKNKYKLTILKIKGNQISIGIEASKIISIQRKNIYDQIKSYNQNKYEGVINE